MIVITRNTVNVKPPGATMPKVQRPARTAAERKADREAKAARMVAADRAAAEAAKPPPRRSREGMGNCGVSRPRSLSVDLVCKALLESGGNVTRAALLLTKWRQEASDKIRARREKTSASKGESLGAETEEERAARHDALRVPARTLREYVHDLPACREAKDRGFQGIVGLARDRLSEHVEKGYFPAVKLVLETHDPAFARRTKVSLDAPPPDPLDAGSLTEEQRQQVLEETADAEDARES